MSCNDQRPDISTMSKVEDLTSTWQDCWKMTNAPNTSGLSNLTTLVDTWHGCNSMTGTPDLASATKVTTLKNAWLDCFSMQSAPDVSGMTNNTSLYYTWNNCYAMKDAPVVSNMTSATNMQYAWYVARAMTNAPFVNTLTNVTDLSFTWGSCSSLTNAPEISNLTLVTNLYATWYDCYRLRSAPDVSTLTNVTYINATWYNCSASSFTNAPAISNLVNLTDISGAWWNCSYLNTAPDISTLVKLKSILNIYRYCTRLQSAPVISTLTNLTTIQSAWYNCPALTSSVDSIFGDYTCLKKVTTSSEAFSGDGNLTGVASNFINAPKAASYTVSTNASSSSYRTFYGCTNLTDYKEIWAEYGGLPDVTNGLVGWWKMNGDANDALGLHNGTNFNGVTTNGIIMDALYFDGVTNSYMELGNLGVTFDSNTDVSVSFWVKNYVTNVTGKTLVICYKADQTDSQGSIVYVSNNICFDIWDDSGTRRIGTQVATTDTWFNVVAVMNQATDTRYLYINGVQNGRDNYTGVGSFPFTSWRVAASRIPTNNNANVAIDDIRIYNRAIASNETLIIYNKGK